MKINQIIIENYKSIKHLKLDLNNKINVFIGENSVGKSNIFSAIQWVIGNAFPTFNRISKQDHYLFNMDNKIKIKLYYDDGALLSMDESEDERFIIKKDHSKPLFSNKEREPYIANFLSADRKLEDYMPSNKWSIIGRFLQGVNTEFLNSKTSDGKNISDEFKKDMCDIREKYLFNVRNPSGDKVIELFMEIVKRESARQLNRNPDDFNIDLAMYDPWNFYRTMQFIINETDLGFELNAADAGMGLQASLSIAILRACSKMKLTDNAPLFIDEPELYLHPIAQRNFYNVLTELAESGTQIFINTHSPMFLSLNRFNEIFVVRRDKENGTKVLNANPSKFVNDLKARKGITASVDDLMLHYQNAYDNTGDSQKANEAFFSKKIILVEGQTECYLLPYFFKLIGFDLIKEGVTIVRTGSKNELDRFYRLYCEVGIPCYIIFDGDFGKTEDEKKIIEDNRAIMSLFGDELDYPDGVPKAGYLGFNKNIEDTLGIPDNQKSLRSYLNVKERINTKDGLPSWVQQVADIISTMPHNANSVLKAEESKKINIIDHSKKIF